MRDENEKSNLLANNIKWTNPYTGKEDTFSAYLPVKCVQKWLQPYFKETFDLDIGDITKFENFLSFLARDLGDLDSFEDFVELCVNDYYTTDSYKEAVAEAIDDYEFEHNLGEYKEDDEYLE